MSTLQEFLRGFASLADRLDEQREKGEKDPLRIVDAMLGGSYSAGPPEGWWELFDLERKPDNKAQLHAAWKRWALRNHPDKGGSEVAFKHMRETFERLVETLPE